MLTLRKFSITLPGAYFNIFHQQHKNVYIKKNWGVMLIEIPQDIRKDCLYSPAYEIIKVGFTVPT